MGDILDLIKSRRNIKHFLPKFVSWEKVSRVLDAGRHAPSCGNLQNWRFIVIFEPGQKQEVASAAYEQYEIIQAGVLIVICAEPEKAGRYYSLRGERLYTIQNCAAAIQNMLLEAHSLGLGARWIGGFDEDAIKSMLGIPEEVRPQAIVALGYPKDVPNKPPKFPLESVVYFSQWRRRMRDPAKYLNDVATILARKGTAAKESLQKAGKFVVDKAKEKTQTLLGKKKDSGTEEER
jgi:nitroreductase